jgi:tetratricopeptide (TPR) repeat protein
LGISEAPDELELLDRAVVVCEMGRKILDDQLLPFTDMPNGVYQDIARYYLNKGDLLTRRVDATMNSVPPEGAKAYERSAEALERARDMDRAVNSASRVSRIQRGVKTEDIMDVGNFRIYQNLGVAYLRLRRFDDAAQAFKDMRRLEPMSAHVYFNLGIVMLQQQQLELASLHLMQALVLQSDWAEAWDKLNMIFNAVAPQAQIVQIDPATGQRRLNAGHPLVRRLLNDSMVNLVQVLIDTKRWDQAKQVIEMATSPNYQCPGELFAPLVWQIPRNTAEKGIGVAAQIAIAIGLLVVVGVAIVVVTALVDRN